MIEKLEAGKTYRLIDEQGFIVEDDGNLGIINDYFSDGEILVDEVIGYVGYTDGTCVITYDEYKYFEEVVTEDITTEEEPPSVSEPTQNAIDRQVGGSHYTDQKMQPIELAYKLNATPAFCKVAKYCSRVKDDMNQQIDKAVHCVELDKALKDPRSYPKIELSLTLDLIKEFTESYSLRYALFNLYIENYNLCFDDLEAFRNEKHSS